MSDISKVNSENVTSGVAPATPNPYFRDLHAFLQEFVATGMVAPAVRGRSLLPCGFRLLSGRRRSGDSPVAGSGWQERERRGPAVAGAADPHANPRTRGNAAGRNAAAASRMASLYA